MIWLITSGKEPNNQGSITYQAHVNSYTYTGKINTCKNFNFKKLPSYDLLLLAFKRVDGATEKQQE